MSDTPSFPTGSGGDQGGQFQAASQQPAAGGNTTLYIVLSVLQLICCNLIFGVIGLVFSIQANSRFSAGDVAGGQAKLKTAKTILIIGVVVGIVLSLGYAAILLASGDLSDSSEL